MLSTIHLQNIVASGSKTPCAFYPLSTFSYTFTFGKTFLLDGWPWDGTDTLSWIIGGVIEPEYGRLLKNNVPYTLKERQQQAWCVRWSTVKVRKLPFQETTVRDQIQHGLKTVAGQYLQHEKEIIVRFNLTPERYVRPLRQFSHEAWRASCAIGLANGKQVFCFPYLGPDFINENYSLWFKPLIDLLKEANALILIPTTAIGLSNTQVFYDEIVPVKPTISSPDTDIE